MYSSKSCNCHVAGPATAATLGAGRVGSQILAVARTVHASAVPNIPSGGSLGGVPVGNIGQFQGQGGVTAQNTTRLLMPVSRPVVMTTTAATALPRYVLIVIT